MTRKEQINLYLKERNIPITSLEANSIIEGIEWADEHPKEANGKELLYVCQRTGEIIKKEMIEKVCEWLQTNIDNYSRVIIDVCSKPIIELTEDFENDFKQAMFK